MLALFIKNGKTRQILRLTARQTISLSSREPSGFEAISYGPAVPAKFSRINPRNDGMWNRPRLIIRGMCVKLIVS